MGQGVRGRPSPHRSGVCLNYLDHDDQDRIADAFDPATYRRLVKLQHTYDPDQVFQPRQLTAVPSSRVGGTRAAQLAERASNAT